MEYRHVPPATPMGPKLSHDVCTKQAAKVIPKQGNLNWLCWWDDETLKQTEASMLLDPPTFPQKSQSHPSFRAPFYRAALSPVG